MFGEPPELVQDVRGLRVLLDVDPVVWEPVARGKLTQPHRIVRMAAADDLETSTRPEQKRPQEKKRSHQIAAERFIFVEDIAQLVGGDGEDCAGLAHDSGEV